MNVELHYYLSEDSHSMDAFIKNKAEGELLKLFSEIISILDLDVEIEFEASSEGGIKDFVKFLRKAKTKKRIKNFWIFFGPIVVGVLINVLSDTLNKDQELDELTKEEKRLNILNLKNDLENDSVQSVLNERELKKMINLIASDHKVKVFKSRFYRQLLKENKIYQFSSTELDKDKRPVSSEQAIRRDKFTEQVFLDEELSPVKVENANVEIVSPVLKQGNIKWKGIYNGKSITFSLLDNEFKNDVLNKRFSFAHGTSIRCNLIIAQSINEDGDVYVKNVDVYDVLEIFDGQFTIETRKNKQIKLLKNQLRLDFGE